MIAYQRLSASGQEGTMSGIADLFSGSKPWFGMQTWVKSYWNTIKGKIGDLQQLGFKISTYQQRIAMAQQKLFARNTPEWDQVARSLDAELEKINDDLQKWWKVKEKIDTYLPQWMGLNQNLEAERQQGIGIVFIPIVLGVAAIAALSYVVTNGMALYQDYQFKIQLTQDVIDGKLNTGQAAELGITAGSGATDIIGKTIGKLGLGLGFGIPTALLVAGGLYVAFSTGLLNKVVNSLPFGKTGST